MHYPQQKCKKAHAMQHLNIDKPCFCNYNHVSHFILGKQYEKITWFSYTYGV